MRTDFTLALAVVLAYSAFSLSPALAYRAEPGVRAANFRGFDIAGRQTIELDDYLGQWVYLEFWGTWCGPCMKDLPEMLETTRPYVDSGRLKVITVNADHPEQLPDVRRVIRELNIDYPVIYDGGVFDETWGYPLPAVEWGVTGFPATFLVNPQGVIVANHLWGKVDLGKVLDFYLNGQRPVMGISGFARVHEGSDSFSVHASVLNDAHTDLQLRLRAYIMRLQWDENNVVTGSEDVGTLPIEMHATVSFDEFCEAGHEFVINTDESWHTLVFSLYLAVPGAEDAVERGEQGYELLFSSREFRRIRLERVDGQWVVQP